MQRRGALLKILVYLGIVLFALLILKNFFAPEHRGVNTSNAETKHHEWTKADKEEMTKDCIANAKDAYQKNPTRITSLCECFTEKFTSKYTYDQVDELNKKPGQEKTDSILPIIDSCKAEIKYAN
jgi:hypothetical protein